MHILASRFLIELDDNSLQIVQPQVDIYGFSLQQTFNTCLLNSLGTGKID